MLIWLASWNRRLFWPAKKTGATGAFAWLIRRAVKFFHSVSTARLCQIVGVVDTPPAGKTTRQPPFIRWFLASARDLRLVFSASSVSAKSTGRRNVFTSSARSSTAFVSTRKSLAHPRDDLADDQAVEHAEGMVGDDDQRPVFGQAASASSL